MPWQFQLAGLLKLLPPCHGRPVLSTSGVSTPGLALRPQWGQGQPHAELRVKLLACWGLGSCTHNLYLAPSGSQLDPPPAPNPTIDCLTTAQPGPAISFGRTELLHMHAERPLKKPEAREQSRPVKCSFATTGCPRVSPLEMYPEAGTGQSLQECHLMLNSGMPAASLLSLTPLPAPWEGFAELCPNLDALCHWTKPKAEDQAPKPRSRELAAYPHIPASTPAQRGET